jgi:hypothetical protein
MREIPSVRRQWKWFKTELMKEPDLSPRELVLAHVAFFTGVRVTWKILGYLVEDDEPEELMRLITKHARQVFAIQGCVPRKRRH